jgi:hypothetical protein
MRPKIQMALVMVVFVRFPERDIVGPFIYFLLLPLCEMEKLFRFYQSAKWKSF